MNLKPAHKPLGAYRIISAVSCGLLVSAFILLLLVALSLSIIKTIYLLSVKSTAVEPSPLSLATELRFGVWGVCATSNLNPATLTNAGTCFGPKLGYDVPADFAKFVNVSQTIINIIQKALLFVLVLHPVTAALAFFSMFFSLFLTSHTFSIFALLSTIILALLSSVALGVDLAIVIIARNQLQTMAGFKLAVGFGNAVWMILVAVLFIWAAVILLSMRACYCLGVRRPAGGADPEDIDGEDTVKRF